MNQISKLPEQAPETIMLADIQYSLKYKKLGQSLTSSVNFGYKNYASSTN